MQGETQNKILVFQTVASPRILWSGTPLPEPASTKTKLLPRSPSGAAESSFTKAQHDWVAVMRAGYFADRTHPWER